ncbi:MAG: 2-amino-4-hydroxy-6-hydroxymethyldihydropteridine diphosphokinase [Chlamydiales bacterium]|nr:2-amino-4-hydroxy-6-hydroxymethyldihydropteridine diphosphokinase [Chlamydiia bacterium]MCP5506957.1 2-amino-4-hydroxy-6-hydroxymethyldihydropteridine diphosphokinase [Chlamydiales bacterium]
MDDSREVYISLGGNMGDVITAIGKALKMIDELPEISSVVCSRLYQTTPVGGIPQQDYVNAMCRIKTTLSPKELFDAMKKIEISFGPRSATRNAPRFLDLDIIFYGTEKYQDSRLEIPHPRWRERLFVVKPLMDLTEQIPLPDLAGGYTWFDLQAYFKEFPNVHQETVTPLEIDRKQA